MADLPLSEVPLRSEYDKQVSLSSYYRPRQKTIFRGPLRAIRLCLLAIILPGLLIAVPLYLRFHVYDHQLYPVGMTDMRVIDSKISTTWCQSQKVKANTTFNAFLMPKAPVLSEHHHVHVEMTRELLLTDDMKEYWGFYLLKGSTVTVSTCARWPGASLILIRGHRNLHECAYIGDDSSEELEELLELAGEKGVKLSSHQDDDNPSNNPNLLKKSSPDVKFLDPKATEMIKDYLMAQKSREQKLVEYDVSGAKEMRNIMNHINNKAGKVKAPKNNTKYSGLREWIANRESKKVEVEIVTTTEVGPITELPHKKHHETFDNIHKSRVPTFGRDEEENIKFEKDLEAPHNETLVEWLQNNMDKIGNLGQRGVEILEGLKKEMSLVETTDNPLNETAVDEHLQRLKRAIEYKMNMNYEFNEDDEDENLGIEEGFVPDDHASHHEIIDENTMFDNSKSEFWSSFSSSEEALLNCEGLILSLPLTPHRNCHNHNTGKQAFLKSSYANAITYTAPVNGYYFFVFSSENEVQDNYIRVHFDLNKTVYNTTGSIKQCSNQTEECSMPLDFYSDEKVVFEMPLSQNESLWNEQFYVSSECVPRTFIYLTCVLSVPVLILLFAFQ